VLDGSEQVTGWSDYNLGLNIWRASVPAGSQARDPWVNGTRAAETKSAINPGGFSQSGASFTTGSGAYLSWGNPAGVEIVDNNQWRRLRCPLSSITATSGGGSSLNMNQACYNATLDNTGFPFNGSGYPTLSHITWIENSYALLTQPGQWYLDSAGGYVYYIPLPGQSMSTTVTARRAVRCRLQPSPAPCMCRRITGRYTRSSAHPTTSPLDIGRAQWRCRSPSGAPL
jgi:hypothetical protein